MVYGKLLKLQASYSELNSERPASVAYERLVGLYHGLLQTLRVRFLYQYHRLLQTR